MDLSKRQYLKAAGASLATLSLGIGGTVATNDSVGGPGVKALGQGQGQAQQGGNGADSGDHLDYETDGSGNIEFVYEGVDFETDDGDVELVDSDGGVDFETSDGDIELTAADGDVDLETTDGNVELRVDNGVHVDLDISEDGESVELVIDTGSEHVDFERNDDGDVEFTADGNSDSFEDDDEIEYNGDTISFEWDDDAGELDVSGDVSLEFVAGEADFEYADGTVTIDYDDGDFEYADGDVHVDYDGEELEYAGPVISFEWENADGGEDDFEARKV